MNNYKTVIINQLDNHININFNINNNIELLNKIKIITLNDLITKIYNMFYLLLKIINKKLNIDKKNNFLKIIFNNKKEKNIILNIKKNFKNIFSISFKDVINFDNISKFNIYLYLNNHINDNNDNSIEYIDMIYNKINYFENTLNSLFDLDIKDILQFLNNYNLYIYDFNDYINHYANHYYFKSKNILKDDNIDKINNLDIIDDKELNSSHSHSDNDSYSDSYSDNDSYSDDSDSYKNILHIR